MQYFDLGEQDIIQCEACSKQGCMDGQGFDLHHINGRIGKDANNIHNLILLCRKCHEKAHKKELSKSELQYIHNSFISGQRIKFIK